MNKPKMKFRWPEFNAYTPSLVDGDMVVIVAESGVGKTSFMLDQAEYLWEQGYHGVVYHFELSTNKMLDRRMARATGVSLRVLQDGRREKGDVYAFMNDSELQSVEEAIGLQETWPGSLALRHCPGWTWEQLCGDIRIRAQEGTLDFVVVDYFNKVQVKPTRGSYLTYDIGRGLELFNTTLEDHWVTGFIAAQFDKSVKRSKSKLKSVADARDSAELDDKSNVGMYLHSPRDPDTGRRAKTVEVHITKCNAGEPGMETLYFDGARFRFLPIVKDADNFGDFVS
jgi:replicative DNA helicase